MKLLEIKNNLVKLSFEADEQIRLASFVALVDDKCSYVGQIVNIKSDQKSNNAIARLIFTFNSDGVVDNYDGSVPSNKSEIMFLNLKDILDLLPVERSILVGELAQQKEMLHVDQTIYENNLVICAEKFDNISTFVKNSVTQLKMVNEKCVVIDTDYNFDEFEPIRFKKNFKLPLNSRMIDFIFENELSEVDATSKAVIQDIFLQVQEYTKTVKGNFIPFDTFLSVVSQQYESTMMPELALLKNKLYKYKEANVFAQSMEDINALKDAISAHSLTYINIADASEELQREIISHIHNVMDSFDGYSYLFVKLNNKIGNKKLLKQLLENEHVFTNIICSHSYKYLPELKQRAENIILFAPQTVQHDFASYNTFLSKLNANEFVIYGALTQNVPFIVELSDLSEEIQNTNFATSDIETAAVVDTSEVETFTANEIITQDGENIFSQEQEIVYGEEQELVEAPVIFEQPVDSERDDLVEQIAKDVDEVFYNNITEEIPSIEQLTPQEEVLTEEDLDFIEDLPDYNNEIQEDNGFRIEEDVNGSEPEFVDAPIQEEFSNDEFIQEQPLIEDIKLTEENVVDSDSVEFDSFDLESNIDDDFEDKDLPIYPAEETLATDDTVKFAQGDMVSHPKYGNGVIEKLIKYGNKTLCSISFENIGRRLLDPAISELEKI